MTTPRQFQEITQGTIDYMLPSSTSPACTTQLALQPITDSQCLDLLNNKTKHTQHLSLIHI